MNERHEFDVFLDELTDFSSLGILPGLERVSRILDRIGSPENKFKAIHILGTNGKGSTSATLESILRSCGLKTALYTSPHLVSISERLLIDGKPLSISAWRNAFEALKQAVLSDLELSAHRPTFFENLTALCFKLIADSDVDIAVIEAGMGGRYDATTACHPIATVVTPIGIDHCEFLGNTLEAIASEKFAAIRPGIEAFYSGENIALSRLFLTECVRKDSPGTLLSMCADYILSYISYEGTDFAYVPREGSIGREHFHTPLIGTHQAQNAANALSVIFSLRERNLLPAGFSYSDEAIGRGVESVRWPGRFEVFKFGGKYLVLDGAHNNQGMTALYDTLEALKTAGSPEVGCIVFGVMRDKDVEEMLEIVSRLRLDMVCTQAPIPRSLESDVLAASAAKRGINVVLVQPDAQKAVNYALDNARTGTSVVCCGSLYLVGHVRGLLQSDE